MFRKRRRHANKTVRLTPEFLKLAASIPPTSLRVTVIQAPFIAPETVTFQHTPPTWRVMVPVGWTSEVSPGQLVSAAYQLDADVLIPSQEIEALQQAILRARDAHPFCPFCGMDPCLDTCVVRKIRQGVWISDLDS